MTAIKGASLEGIPAAGARLDLGRSSIYELLAAGEIKSVKIGRRRLIVSSSIDEFIARSSQEAS